MPGKSFTVTVNTKTYELVEKFAEEKGLSKSAIVTLALEKYAREEGGNERK